MTTPATNAVAAPADSAPKPVATKKAAAPKASKAPVKKQAAEATPTKAPAATPKGKAKAAAPEADSKAKKPKLVRDSFTIPKDEYEALTALKQRAVQLAQPTKKSELLRAGLKWLSQLDDATFLLALKAVPAIKTGRPKGDEAPKAKDAAKKSKG